MTTDQITDQHRAPIVDALREHQRESSVSFAPPGHQAGEAAPSDVKKLLGTQAFKGDTSTLKGIDDRRERKRTRQNAERLAAQAWGAEHCYFSTNGTSLSNHVAMLAVAAPGDTVLVARNSHKSLIASCIIGGVRPVFLEPDADPVWDVHHGIAPDELARALDAHPDAKGVFITSPSYYGVTSDVATLADLCHRRGIPLVVDEAWGPHFPFHPEMPRPALQSGADISVASIHKTMAGLEQASIMLFDTELVDRVRFELCYDLFESTSPSVPILASIDATRRQFVDEGERIVGEELRMARHIRQELAKIDGIRVMGREVLDGRGRFALDETKLLADISALGVTGYDAEDWLLREEELSLGLSDDRHLLIILTAGTTDKHVRRLLSGVKAMARWARSRGEQDGSPAARMPRRQDVSAELVMTPGEAFFAAAEEVPLEAAAGRIAAQMVSPYPPGIPGVLPGERITETHVAFLGARLRAGAFVMDARITNDGVIRVVASR